MNTSMGFEKCLNFISSQSQPPGTLPLYAQQHRAVTLSRQSGCGAHVLAEKLAAYLQWHAPKEAPKWTVFDRDLMEKVLADHHLPEGLAKLMPEDRVSEMEDILCEVFHMRPDAWTLIRQTSETVLKLAELGNVILLGRGANVITAKVPGVLHVRLVASLETRIQHMCHFEELTRAKAVERIHREDLGRARYLQKYFQRDIDDASLYHLVLNLDLISHDVAAWLIGDMVLHGMTVAEKELAGPPAKVCV
jgi:cytidylate kinase